MFASLKNKIKEETGNDVRRHFPIGPRPNSTVENVPPNGDSAEAPAGYEKETGTSREKELLTYIETLKKEHAAALETKDRYFALQTERKTKDWNEKMTSLKNAMQAAQAVWSGEAAAARREARAEARKCVDLTERLEAITSTTAQLQDRLDTLQDDVETERRTWALERVKLAKEAEDAIHRLSLAEASLCDENSTSETSATEMALKRKLEETHLHLHDIKTSWSGQIAALETQVGRLSRQAGEEGSERRRVEKERDTLLERLKEKDMQLEQAQATLEDKEAKMALLAAEVGDVSRARREAREEAVRNRDISVTMENNLSELEKRLTEMKKEIETFENDNKNLKQYMAKEQQKNVQLNVDIESYTRENVNLIESKTQLENRLEEVLRNNEEVQSLLDDRSEKNLELMKEIQILKEHNEMLKKEVNEIHDRYDKERRDKDEALIRNAHMSQTLEIYRQEMRQQDFEVVDMKEKIANLQKTVAQNLEDQNTLLGLKDQEEQRKNEVKLLESERDNALSSEKQLQECIKDLNSQLQEKTKNIRVLQNRLTDMKKTLQRELRGGQVDPLGSSVVEGSAEDPDVSKKYLKHVLIKFLTSREIEARQLTKAVSALLGLSEQEESLLRETLSWRNGFAAWLTPPPRFSHS